jgi:hypothetical protein
LALPLRWAAEPTLLEREGDDARDTGTGWKKQRWNVGDGGGSDGVCERGREGAPKRRTLRVGELVPRTESAAVAGAQGWPQSLASATRTPTTGNELAPCRSSRCIPSGAGRVVGDRAELCASGARESLCARVTKTSIGLNWPDVQACIALVAEPNRHVVLDGREGRWARWRCSQCSRTALIEIQTWTWRSERVRNLEALDDGFLFASSQSRLHDASVIVR